MPPRMSFDHVKQSTSDDKRRRWLRHTIQTSIVLSVSEWVCDAERAHCVHQAHVSYEEISASRDTRPRQVSHKRLSRLMRAHIACKIHSLLSTMTTTNRGSLGMKGSVSFQRVQLSGTLWAIFCMHFFYSLVSVHSPSVSVFLLVVSLSPSSI